MKKLMTLMAAAAFGLSALADMTWPNGESFESFEIPQDKDSVAVTIDVLSGGGVNWEAPADEETTLEVKKYAEGEAAASRPAQFSGDNTKYLHVNTTLGQMVERKFLTGDELTDGPTGYFVDTLVKFTPCSSDLSLSIVNDNSSKLAVWVRVDEDADPATTNLMVTANLVNDEGDRTAANILCTVANVDLSDVNQWHRLTIKAISDISPDTANLHGFVVYVDGNPVSSTRDDAMIGVEVYSEWAAYNNAKQLFASLSTLPAIKGVALSGNGAIDDISFTQTAPFPGLDTTEYYTIAGNEDIQSFKVGETTWTAGDDPLQFVFDVNNIPTISITDITITDAAAAAGKYVVSATAQVTPSAENKTLLVGEVAVAKATVTIGEETTPCETLAAAVALANASTAAATITLTGDYDGAAAVAIDNANGATVTLDLAGHAINNVVTIKGSVIIDNSDASVDANGLYKGRIIGADVGEEGYPAWASVQFAKRNAELRINGGYFANNIEPYSKEKATVFGGQFADHYGQDGAAYSLVSGVEGKTLALDDTLNVYVLVDDEPAQPTVFKITYIVNGEEDSTDSYTEGDGATLKAGANIAGYTFAGWYDNENCTGDAVTAIDENATGDKTFYAKMIAMFGSVEEITEYGTASGNGTANASITVANNDTPIKWVEADTNIGRTEDGYWVGVKVIAPEGYTVGDGAKLGTAEDTFNISFDESKDGDNWVGIWCSVKEEEVGEGKEQITRSFYFDWNNDGMLDQTITVVIDAATIKLEQQAPPTPEEIVLAPGAGVGVSVTVTAESEDAAKALVKLTAPEGSGVSADTYAGYFTKNAESNGNGGYVVTAVLNNANNALEPDVKSENLLADKLGEIAAGKVESVSVGNAKAGLYYTLHEGATLNLAPTRCELATGATVTLPITTKGGTSGFYRIIVTPYPVEIPAK